MNFWIPWKAGNLTSWAIISFWRRTLLHCVSCVSFKLITTPRRWMKNGRVIMNPKFHPGITEEAQKQTCSCPEFKPETYRTRNRSANHIACSGFGLTLFVFGVCNGSTLLQYSTNNLTDPPSLSYYRIQPVAPFFLLVKMLPSTRRSNSHNSIWVFVNVKQLNYNLTFFFILYYLPFINKQFQILERLRYRNWGKKFPIGSTLN
jgi:hypothetical protein